ncbi:MAG: hypothetical protein Q4A61_05170 [Porphyromonadaceae bacterium]|nr:hypothetical protein [Porphyromonadaceae bacterium]
MIRKSKGNAPRPHKLTLKLNERELKALELYCREYGIANRSEWLRELMMIEIISRIEGDSPYLFPEEEMR